MTGTNSAMRRDDSVTTDSPLVSVVIPSYNASRTIVRAIDSALRQSYSRLEIIVSDDGSTDATSELVSKFSDPRVSFHVATANGGAAAARNRGIRASSGSYVAFLWNSGSSRPGCLKAMLR